MDDRSPLAQAIADLAERTGASRDDIAVNAHEQVTWRDGALGCPKPGMMYTQALVDGYRIVLEVNGELFHYHGAGGREPFYCDQPDRGGTLGPQTDR